MQTSAHLDALLACLNTEEKGTWIQVIKSACFMMI